MKCLVSKHLYFIWVAQSHFFYQRAILFFPILFFLLGAPILFFLSEPNSIFSIRAQCYFFYQRNPIFSIPNPIFSIPNPNFSIPKPILSISNPIFSIRAQSYSFFNQRNLILSIPNPIFSIRGILFFLLEKSYFFYSQSNFLYSQSIFSIPNSIFFIRAQSYFFYPRNPIFSIPNSIFPTREIVVLGMGESEKPYLRLWSHWEQQSHSWRAWFLDESFHIRNSFYDDIFVDVRFKRFGQREKDVALIANTSTFVSNGRSQCPSCFTRQSCGAPLVLT